MARRAALLLLLLAASAAAAGRKEKAGEKVCDKGWECSGNRFCCNETISDYFKAYQFEELFAHRNDAQAHAPGFWDYQAFITAAALFEPQGFCTTGGKQMQMMELCAFLGHVGAKTSCKRRFFLSFGCLLCASVWFELGFDWPAPRLQVGMAWRPAGRRRGGSATTTR